VLKGYENAHEDLLTPAESSRIVRSVSSFPWNRGAHAEFTADGNYFWVWLPWGRVMLFDGRTGNALDAGSFRLDFTRGRPTLLETAEVMAESAIPSQRIAAAHLAGWLGGQAVLPILRKLQSDPYHKDTGQLTQGEDPWGRFSSAPFFLIRRLYPVRRAAAEEIHIHFGHTDAPVEELVAR
jgi:hypothetical protein